jgi:RNA polymerase sigma-70 factor, ECF subfamily
MVPLSEQNPHLWNRSEIAEAQLLLAKATELGPPSARTLQARLQEAWSERQSLNDPPPWRRILALYDELLTLRDDAVVRINRAVALAEVSGPESALLEFDQLDSATLHSFLPYHAVRADLLLRAGRREEARAACMAAIALGPAPAEKRWIRRKYSSLGVA